MQVYSRGYIDVIKYVGTQRSGASGLEANAQNEIAKINEILTKFILRGNPAFLNENEFSDELRNLVQNMNQLFAHYEELKTFSVDLTEGNLTGTMPKRNNWLAGPLKSLHAQILHIGWQAKQVAEGDYSQKVDFMGDFSEAFNRMVTQLSERERQLELGQKALRTVLEHTPNSVIVMDRKTKEIMFQNKAAKFLLASDMLVEQGNLSTVEQVLSGFEENCEESVTWELSSANPPLYLSVHSSQINWLNRPAYLHTLRDSTEDKQAEEELRTFAYYDGSTGVGNRNSGLDYLKKQLAKQCPFIVVFIDMDGLKYINDTFGHVAGDFALRELAQTLNSTVRDGDCVFRMGGDEFLIVFHKGDQTVVERVVSRVRNILTLKNEQLDYSIAFSAGSYLYDGGESVGVEELLQRVDSVMYLEKRKKKSSR